ncbi:hypothetical protein G9A89_011976 [Geosiphon pyriformis]|nr:hypothetical protein G9A89_011976 [Geosiphon pyriformis]
MKLTSATSAKHTIENNLNLQKKVKNRTIYLVLYVEIYYQKNAIGLMLQGEEEATQEDICQIKKAEYIEYTIELAGFDYEDKVETYYQITSHIYSTKEAQIQQLEQMNIQLCKECVMPCNNQWCLEYYALNILLSDENNKNKIEFRVSELIEKLLITPIYFLENQLSLQLKYFDNHGQRIRPEKTHEIDAKYDLRYPGKDTLVFQPKFLTKINLKIAFEILPGAIVQIAFKLLLASKGINIKGRIIDAGYMGDITIMLQNETEKSFKIKHIEEIA